MFLKKMLWKAGQVEDYSLKNTYQTVYVNSGNKELGIKKAWIQSASSLKSYSKFSMCTLDEYMKWFVS